MIELIDNKIFHLRFVWFPNGYFHLGLSVHKYFNEDIEDENKLSIVIGLLLCHFRIYIKK